MAKRFTDTDKWSKNWFSGLDVKGKLLWLYLCDRCDCAGIIDINEKLISFQMGFKVSLKGIYTLLEGKVYPLGGSRVFLPTFIEFQYGKLSEGCRPHAPVLKILKEFGLLEVLEKMKMERVSKGYPKGMDTLKDKDSCCSIAPVSNQASVKATATATETTTATTTAITATATFADINSANDNNIAFEEFWARYPKRSGRKKSAELWHLLPPDKRQAAICGLGWYLASRRVKDGYILDPERYIKREVWNDDPTAYNLGAQEIGPLEKMVRGLEELDNEGFDDEADGFNTGGAG
jgi:hypothetical protein